MSEVKEKIYVGNAKIKEGQYGKIMKLKIGPSDLEKINNWAKDNAGWVNIDIFESKKVSDKGYTHYAQLDTWKPDSSRSAGSSQSTTSQSSVAIDPDNLPF